MNISESNNSFLDFKQVWSNYVFVDQLPETPPELSEAYAMKSGNNKDGTVYTIYKFQKSEHEKTYDYMIYLSNFELTKEFRQGKSWKVEFAGSEETIRNIILPGISANRKYLPTFSNGSFEIPFTSLDPDFDFADCRINVSLNFDKLYFSGWLYIGKNLQTILESGLPPFDDKLWLLKDNTTGKRVSFHVNQEVRYELPDNTFDDTEDSNTIISTNILNQALNKFGVLDEGQYW